MSCPVFVKNIKSDQGYAAAGGDENKAWRFCFAHGRGHCYYALYNGIIRCDENKGTRWDKVRTLRQSDRRRATAELGTLAWMNSNR